MRTYFESRGISRGYYDNFELPQYLQKFLELKENKDLNILDFGCGYGQFLLALKKNGFKNIVGCDINDDALDFLRSKQVTVMQAGNTFNEYKNCFDIVLMNHVLEHFPKDQVIDIVAKIRNDLLVENGQLIISVPNAQSFTGCYWAYEDFTHNTLFTAGSLKYVLMQAGFSKIEFLDPLSLDGAGWKRKTFVKLGIWMYELRNKFWMKITDSHYHKPSPRIYSYEIKVVASV